MSADMKFEQPTNEEAPQRPTLRARAFGILRAMFGTRIDKSGARLRIVACAFVCIYAVIGGRLIYLGMTPEPQTLRRVAAEASSRARPAIVDRNGEILAADVMIDSVFAEPRNIVDKDEAVELLTAVLPDLDAKELRDKLGSRRGFVWVKRGVTPKERAEVFRLGLPGVGFLPEHKRVYPNGPIAAHVIGFTNVDNIGIAGMEKYIDSLGFADLSSAGFKVASQDMKPIKLSLDLKATHAVRDELIKGIELYKAKAAAAAIMDVNTGEIIAIASLPDYDPNNPVDALEPTRIRKPPARPCDAPSANDARRPNVSRRNDAGNVASAAPSSMATSGRTAIDDFGASSSPARGSRPSASVCDSTDAAKPPASVNRPRAFPSTGAPAGQKQDSRPARGGAEAFSAASVICAGPRPRGCAMQDLPCRHTGRRASTRGRRRAMCRRAAAQGE